MRHGCVPLLLLVSTIACGNNKPIDAGQSIDGTRTCVSDNDCGPWSEGWSCRDNICVALCADEPNGFTCNYGFASDFPPECCSADQHCCYISFERESCSSTPCPIACNFATDGWNDWARCAADSYCEYTSDAQPDGGPGVGECARYTTVGACVSDCPEARRCGETSCCGLGTTCIGACCAIEGTVDAGP